MSTRDYPDENARTEKIDRPLKNDFTKETVSPARNMPDEGFTNRSV